MRNDALKTILSPKIEYVYRPNGGNLGDFVISSAEHDFFKKNSIQYQQITKENVDDILSKPFNLIFGGGGGWVSLYKNHDKIAKKYFLNDNLKSCVIFPSTFYDVNNIIDLFDERFTVFCRDYQSLAYCKSLNNKAKFLFSNDIGFSLELKKYRYNSLNHVKVNKIKTVIKQAHEMFKDIDDFSKGFFIRNDIEKKSIKIEIKNNIDISALCGVSGENLSKDLAKEGTELFLYLINKFRHVITNRLHVGIIGLLLGKTVILFDNSYGKIKSVYEASMKDMFDSAIFIEV